MTYILKNIPEDFVVKEISSVQPQKEGKYSYFLLKKKNYNTLKALEIVARALNVPLKFLGFAGNKDRRAVTEQVCSVEGVGKERLERLELKDIEVEFLGKGKEPVHLGQHEGNYFEVVVRNLDCLPEISSRFVNFFGKQRFSVQNPEIGKAIVKRDFRLAAELLAKAGFKDKMQSFIEKHDYLGALRCVSRRLLILFVHAYQSFIWNQMALMYAEKHKTNIVIPVVGFGSVIDDKCALEVLENEKVSPKDFVVKELPEVSAEGTERALYAEAKDLFVGELEPDEFFLGKKKVLLSFTLDKGCYATEFIRQQFG